MGAYLTPAPTAPPPTQTALIVPMPVADPIVGAYRRRLDPAARLGVPAHVTVLYPFLAPAEVDDAARTQVAELVDAVPRFSCTFAQTRWFGQDVVWLDPEPDQPFRDLTNAVTEAFPNRAAYGGAHSKVVPHLTLGQRRSGSLGALKEAEHEVKARLPLQAQIDIVLWIAGSRAPESWSVLHSFALR